MHRATGTAGRGLGRIRPEKTPLLREHGRRSVSVAVRCLGASWLPHVRFTDQPARRTFPSLSAGGRALPPGDPARGAGPRYPHAPGARADAAPWREPEHRLAGLAHAGVPGLRAGPAPGGVFRV